MKVLEFIGTLIYGLFLLSIIIFLIVFTIKELIKDKKGE